MLLISLYLEVVDQVLQDIALKSTIFPLTSGVYFLLGKGFLNTKLQINPPLMTSPA